MAKCNADIHVIYISTQDVCGTDGKSQDVPGHLGTKWIWLTWDLHVRYPQCESTVKRKCQRCTHFTYNHVRPACVQREYVIIAGRPPHHTSNHCHYSAAVHIHVHVHVHGACILQTVHVHVYYILCMYMYTTYCACRCTYMLQCPDRTAWKGECCPVWVLQQICWISLGCRSHAVLSGHCNR